MEPDLRCAFLTWAFVFTILAYLSVLPLFAQVIAVVNIFFYIYLEFLDEPIIEEQEQEQEPLV